VAWEKTILLLGVTKMAPLTQPVEPVPRSELILVRLRA
jgi:hypothetical protein